MKTSSQPNQQPAELSSSTVFRHPRILAERAVSSLGQSPRSLAARGFSWNRRTLSARLDEMSQAGQWQLPIHLQHQLGLAQLLLARNSKSTRSHQKQLLTEQWPDLMTELALFETQGELRDVQEETGTTTRQARALHRRIREVRNSSYLRPEDDPVLGLRPNPGLDSFISKSAAPPDFLHVI